MVKMCKILNAIILHRQQKKCLFYSRKIDTEGSSANELLGALIRNFKFSSGNCRFIQIEKSFAFVKEVCMSTTILNFLQNQIGSSCLHHHIDICSIAMSLDSSKVIVELVIFTNCTTSSLVGSVSNTIWFPFAFEVS